MYYIQGILTNQVVESILKSNNSQNKHEITNTTHITMATLAITTAITPITRHHKDYILRM